MSESEKKIAVIFDRDGVINQVVMRDSIVSSPRRFEEFIVRDDFVELYEQIDAKFFSMFVISNQPDIARGLLPENELKAMTEALLDKFSFTKILYCEHDDSAQCLCRKPKPGMILQILSEFGVNPLDALIVGDSAKDIGAGKAAGVRTIYLRREYNKGSFDISELPPNSLPDFTIDRLPQLIPILEAML